MTKFKICLLIMFIVTVISGCSNKKYTQDYNNIEIDSAIKTKFPNFTFDNNKGQYYMPYGTAAAENGYYYITTPDLFTEENKFIYYYDMTSQTSVPLCSNLQCKHNDSSCNAFASDEKCLGQMLWYHSGKLYMIERTQEKDSLVSYDKEGRNKQQVCVLSNGKDILGFKTNARGAVCMSGDYMYYILSNVENATGGICDAKVCRMKIDGNSKAEELGTIKMSTDVSGSGSFNFHPIDDKVYIFTRHNLTSSEKAYTIFKYDIANNSFESIMDIKYTEMPEICRGKILTPNSDWVIDRDQNIYFVSWIQGENINRVGVNGTAILNKYNTETKENQEIYVLEGSESELAGQGALTLGGYDGTYIYFYETMSMTTLKNVNLLENSNNIVVMNTDGSIADKIHLNASEEFLKKYKVSLKNININILGGDERYLMITTGDGFIKGIEESDETILKIKKAEEAPIKDRIHYATNSVAVFDKNQIGTDEDTWIKVK